MKMPSLPPLNRRATLLAAGGIAVLVLLFFILAIALGGANTDDTPRPATAETAENATPETPAATEIPRAADLAVQTAAVGTVLPQTEDAGRSYVDETLFIGDSNTARYLMYADETGEAFTSLDNNIGVVSIYSGTPGQSG